MSKAGRVAGLCYGIEYQPRQKAEVTPDEIDLAAASDRQVATLFAAVGEWSIRFAAENPGWKINGRRPEDDHTI
ncbi:MAG: hypothetical protein ACRC7O_12300 [Fimbriiglobus sp.]